MIRHTATLARLKLSEKDLASLVKKTEAVLAYVEQLKELDTTSVEPTAHAGEAGHPSAELRDDTITPSELAQDILDQAPHHFNHHIEVPKVIDS